MAVKPCVVMGCNEKAGTRYEFCRSHWLKVPLSTKDIIAEAYKTIQSSPMGYNMAVNKAARLIWQEENNYVR